MTALIKKNELSLWLTAFITLCLCFLPLLCGFVWGNHDWLPLKNGTNLTSGLIEGRFTQFILPFFLLSGQILPVFSQLLGFAFYAAALVLLLTRFFEIKADNINFALIIATIASLPFITEILYFHFIVLSQLFWPLIIVFSLLAAKKAYLSRHPVAYTLLSLLLLLTALGGYPASAGFFITSTCILIFIELKKAPSNKQLFYTFTPFVISFLGAFLILIMIYAKLKAAHLTNEMYNNHTPNILSLLTNILPTLKLSFLSLITPQPFFSLTFKLLTAFIILSTIVIDLHQCNSLAKRLCHIGLWIFLILMLKFPALISSDTPDSDNYFSQNDPAAFMVRADFYALPPLLLFCLSTFLQSKFRLIKNFSFIMTALLLWLNINTNLSFAKTHLLGFTAENRLIERLSSRIQNTSSFSPYVYYTIVQAGELPLRQKYYTASPLEKYGLYTLKTPYIRHWLPHEYYNFYPPFSFVKSASAITPETITNDMTRFLTTQIKSWPSPDSLYVDDTYAVIALTPTGKEMLTGQFNQLQRGYHD